MHEFTRELGARRRVRQTRGTRASPVLCVAGQCVPSGCVAAPGVVRGNVSAPGNVPGFLAKRRAGRLVLVDAKDETRDREGRRPQKTAERDLDILAPAKRSSRDITTAMRNTVLPAAHARDDTASHIRPTASGDGDDKVDKRRKKRTRGSRI